MKTEIRDRILILTLDRPSRGNSFGLDAARALSKALKQNQKSKDIDALLFRAEGRLFCAGGDLDDYASHTTPAQGKKVNREITAALKALAEWPKPTAVVVQGDCFGGGVELISAFDKVFCVPNAFIGLWQRRIGLSFGWGGGARLEKRLGLSRLRLLSLEARSISSHEALGVGLVDEIVLLSQIEATARKWLKETSVLPTAPLAGLKKFLSSNEASLFSKLWWNPEHSQVLSARKNKR